MGSSQTRKLLCSLATLLPAFCFSISEDAAWRGRVNFLLQRGDRAAALQVYDDHVQTTGKQDFAVLQQLALNILEQGSRSRKPEILLLTLYGAGISAHEKALDILEDAINSPYPQIQLVALHLLGQWETDRTADAIKVALRSNYILLRLEAAYQLAALKFPQAAEQIEALSYKTDPEVLAVLPQLFALAGSADAIKHLRRLLSHSDPSVRVEAILSAAEFGRDDLLPQIRLLATQTGASQLEACAIALGELHDESSAPLLISMAQSHSPFVRLAALQALYKLGRKDARLEIEKIAAEDVPYAILMLGEMPGSEPLLIEKCKSPKINVRVNAALALLELKNPQCVPVLNEILIQDERDLAFTKAYSHGGGLYAWKVVTCAGEYCDDQKMAEEVALQLREEVLAKAIELPESDFLKIAAQVFERRQNSLVPTLVVLMANLDTPAAIELLKKYQQLAGAPFIRTSCNLALYQMKEDGPWEGQLEDWVSNQQNKQLIEFRPMFPWQGKGERSPHTLTPEETTRLLIGCFEAFAKRQDDKGVNVLLKAMENGHPDNIYVLAGLLLRATQ